MTGLEQHKTYRDLPALAGLCEMRRAIKSDWSLDESVARLKRIHYVLRRIHETLLARIPGEPIYELKTLYSHHAYLCAEQVTSIRRRVSEMREHRSFQGSWWCGGKKGIMMVMHSGASGLDDASSYVWC